MIKLERISAYIERRRVFRFIFLSFFKGYKILNESNGTIVIKNLFNNCVYKIPNNIEYINSISPKNEILVDSFIKMKEGIFIDIGAYVGKYSLRIAKNKKIRVFAIEPNPKSFSILIENSKLNNLSENFIPLNFAIHEGDKKILSFIDNYAMSQLSGDSDIVEDNKIIQVKKISIKDLFRDYIKDLEKNILIKIDVEGYEFQILKALYFLFNQNSTLKIICEILPNCIHKSEIIDFMKKNKFKARQIDSSNFLFEMQ
jgi:FkbM family methyltransferase